MELSPRAEASREAPRGALVLTASPLVCGGSGQGMGFPRGSSRELLGPSRRVVLNPECRLGVPLGCRWGHRDDEDAVFPQSCPELWGRSKPRTLQAPEPLSPSAWAEHALVSALLSFFIVDVFEL